MLKQRIITALVLGAAFISIVFYGSNSLFILLMIIAVLFSAWEWTALCAIQNRLSRYILSFLMPVIMLAVYFSIQSAWTHAIPVIGVIWWCIAAVMVIFFQQGKQIIPSNKVLNYLIGYCVLLPATLSLIYLYQQENGKYIVLLFFILIWVVDSAAYFTGRRWGKHRLADRVSPGKSREGFLGSLVFAGLPAGIYVYIKGISGIEILWVLVLFITTAVFSAVGDLFESMYKRQVNLKDSSQLLPGHGGLLDRIDSLTAGAPVFMLGLWLLGERT